MFAFGRNEGRGCVEHVGVVGEDSIEAMDCKQREIARDSSLNVSCETEDNFFFTSTRC